MSPDDERLLQKAAAALTAHYVDTSVRDRLLADQVDAPRAFALLDMAAALVGGAAARKDPEQWLATVTTDAPGIERSVVVFDALSALTGQPADRWAATFAVAASPESALVARRPNGPSRPF